MKIFAFPLIAVSTLSLAATDPSPFPFDRTQLSGWWGESYNTDPACAPENLKMKMEITQDGKRFNVRFHRRSNTALGDTDGFTATVLSATSRAVVIRYDNETRMKPSGQPVEWELAVVAPGVYRWRETDWKPGAVNTVVGIRCSQ